MSLIRAAAITASAATALVLGGCSAASSSVTISYERDGVVHTETINPDTVTCNEDKTSGVSVSNDPAGQFTFRTPDEPGAGHVTAAVTAEGENDSLTFVYFEGDSAAPDTSTPGTVTVAENTGTVILIDDWDAKLGTDFDREDGTELEATISAEIHCDDD